MPYHVCNIMYHARMIFLLAYCKVERTSTALCDIDIKMPIGGLSLMRPVKDEASRGVVASLISTSSMLLFEAYLDSKNVSSSAIYTYYDLILGNLVSFVADIVLSSKVGFCLISQKPGCSAVDLSASRMSNGKHSSIFYLLKSIGGQNFLRFIITVVIDMMITVPLFVKWKELYPNTSIFKEKMVKTVINFVSFIVYANVLRFNWAYLATDDPAKIHDMIVVSLIVLVSLIFLNTKDVEEGGAGYSVMNKNSKMYFAIIAFSLIGVYQMIQTYGYNPKWAENDTFIILKGIFVLGAVIALVIYGLSNKSSHVPLRDEDGNVIKKKAEWIIPSVMFVVSSLLLIGLIFLYTR